MTTYMTAQRNTITLGLGPLVWGLRNFVNYRRTLAALRALPVEVLNDLGIERHALKQAARKAALSS